MGFLARGQITKAARIIKGMFGAKDSSSGPETAIFEPGGYQPRSTAQSRQANRNGNIPDIATEVDSVTKTWLIRFLVHISSEDFHEIVLRASQMREDSSWQKDPSWQKNDDKKVTTEIIESNGPFRSPKREFRQGKQIQGLPIKDFLLSKLCMAPETEEIAKSSASVQLKCRTAIHSDSTGIVDPRDLNLAFANRSTIPRSSTNSLSNENLRLQDSPLLQNTSETPASRMSTPAAFNILNNVFPADTLKKLKYEMGSTIATYHADASVFFSDITGFTDWCSTQSACTVIECLSAYFQILDDLAEQFGVYKVETIGDAWVGVCGAPNEALHHADLMGHFALEVLETLHDLQEIFQSPDITMRMGIHCGPLVSGVVRADRPRWQLFGDTVNMASRMESTSLPGHIQISRDMHDALERSPRTKFICKSRGQIEIKGKGPQEMFFLEDLEDEIMSDFTGTGIFHIDEHRLTIFNPDSTSGSSQEFNDRLSRTKSSRISSMSKYSFRSSNSKSSKRQKNSPLQERVTIATPDDFAEMCDSSSLPPESTRRSLSRAADPSTSYRVEDKLEVAKYLGQHSILVVDNMASIIMQFRRVLKKTGMTVYTAQNGHEALKLLKERRHIIAYIDLDLLKMDGFQWIRQFREWECQHRAWTQPIVAMCEYDISEVYQDSLSIFGFDGFNKKDVNKDTILKQVSKFRFTSSNS